MDARTARIAAALVATVVIAAGCSATPARPPESELSTSAPAASAVGTAPSGEAPSGAAAEPEPAPVPKVGAAALEHARKLGGTAHEGETLYFVIGGSFSTEAQARSALEKATPLFGDMQSYFIVQRSDAFDGMRPGWWVVTEAYRRTPSAENLQFARRGFPGAYVKRAVVRTADPIPVYEDLVPGAGP
jgi:hypothetical protein